jgi:two-component sensor histidine kinase
MMSLYVGLVAGVSAMLAGGVLAWYVFLTPFSWSTGREVTATLLGYLIVSSLIVGTSQLYRRSEQQRRDAELQAANQKVESSNLFAREMAHRLKNALAIVQAIAGQTFEKDDVRLATFAGRLQAFSGAHNLLTEHISRPTAYLCHVVVNAFKPFAERDDRFEVDGPPIQIRDQQVVSISLALHELGTNAVKYGALSNSQGRVTVKWRANGPAFELEWKEHDGPLVIRPQTRGFGTRLLSRAAMRAQIRFEPDGVRCIIRGHVA